MASPFDNIVSQDRDGFAKSLGAEQRTHEIEPDAPVVRAPLRGLGERFDGGGEIPVAAMQRAEHGVQNSRVGTVRDPAFGNGAGLRGTARPRFRHGGPNDVGGAVVDRRLRRHGGGLPQGTAPTVV